MLNFTPMFTLLMLSILALVGFTMSRSTPSQLGRMSLAFSVAHKPYERPTKPKPKGGTKDKFMHLMARALYSGIGPVGMSGSIQGTVFLKNNIIRVKRMPNNVRNAFTQFVRGMFSGTSTAWKSLTAAQVLTWTSSSSLYFSRSLFSVAYQLKGNTIFQRVNNILASIGVTPMAVCPTVAVPAFVIVSGVATADASAQSLAVDITEFNAAVAIPANTYIKAYATPQVNVGISSFGESDYRFIGYYSPAAATNPLVLTVEYLARFAPLVVGNRIGIALEVVSTNGTTTFGKSGRFFVQTVVVV